MRTALLCILILISAYVHAQTEKKYLIAKTGTDNPYSGISLVEKGTGNSIILKPGHKYFIEKEDTDPDGYILLKGGDSLLFYVDKNATFWSLSDLFWNPKTIIYIKNKYGEKIWKTIFDRQVQIGWTKELCELSWGKPKKINTTITKVSRSEQWVYSLDSYLYFENGRLTTIQN